MSLGTMIINDGPKQDTEVTTDEKPRTFDASGTAVHAYPFTLKSRTSTDVSYGRPAARCSRSTAARSSASVAQENPCTFRLKVPAASEPLTFSRTSDRHAEECANWSEGRDNTLVMIRHDGGVTTSDYAITMEGLIDRISWRAMSEREKGTCATRRIISASVIRVR